MAAKNSACLFRQPLLPLPDLLLHPMRQVFALPFEPRIEHFRLLHFCPHRERDRLAAARLCVLSRRLFTDPVLQ